MRQPTVSEPDFLLTELRYTLEQLGMQLEALETEGAEGPDRPQRVAEAMGSMDEYERLFQTRYAAVLETSAPDASDMTASDASAVFRERRRQTLALLESRQAPPTIELVSLLREHVALDRKHVTDIADQRPGVLEHDQREQENGEQT